MIVRDHDHVRLHARVPIAACSQKGSGRFMLALPGHDTDDLLLTPDQYIDNVSLRFGLGLARRVHVATQCGCGVPVGDFISVQKFFDHVLSCKSGCRGMKLARHNLLLPIFAKFFKFLPSGILPSHVVVPGVKMPERSKGVFMALVVVPDVRTPPF